MTTTANHHGILSLSFLLLLLPPQIIIPVGAQSGSGSFQPDHYAKFSPLLVIVIAVLVTALVFLILFTIYIRHFSDDSYPSAVLPQLAAAARARGFDQSVIEANFPTFSYSEVKDHKIGKGALECAVCLNEFEDDNETLRLIPKCDHVFHPECIDAWLEYHVTCPVCRANLDPQPEDLSGLDPSPVLINNTNAVEISNLRNDEIVIQIDNENRGQEIRPVVNRNLSFENSNRSVRKPRIISFGKFRSHSTGHSLVQPGENLERFTLRLPNEVMNRALNRTRSFATTLPGEGSSKKRYKTNGGGEGSSRAGRFYRRIGWSDREVKSDRWVFFMRGLSMNLRSPKVAGEGSGSVSKSGGSRTPVKMPSFKCLEPRSSDEKCLVITNETARPST
ncbi:hypothetical protein ACJIZ3_022450 [Penstemon smallii]|uniref:RING-type E3 ubiquitin transferase n=1 Tax=Penstemon smallii TaxID=265156 RepID=A0ABD3TLC2_9LAMI